MSEQSVSLAKKIYATRVPWVDCPSLSASLGEPFRVQIQPIDLRSQVTDPDILILMMAGKPDDESPAVDPAGKILSNLKADRWIDDIMCLGVIDPKIVDGPASEVNPDNGEIHVSALREDRQLLFQAILDLSGYGGGSAAGGTFRSERDGDGAGPGSEEVSSSPDDATQSPA